MKIKPEYRLIWLEPNGRAVEYLHRYAGVPKGKPPCPGHGLHDAQVELSRGPGHIDKDGSSKIPRPQIPANDPRWPTKCDHCDFVFINGHCHHLYEPLYTRHDNGKEVTKHDAPIGAMWDGWWYKDTYRGPDGICLVLRTPSGDWLVDSRAGNCKAPKDVVHQCWPRNGNPKNPQGSPPLDVPTGGGACKVGGGSIQMGAKKGANSYHGFLTKGYLATTRKK